MQFAADCSYGERVDEEEIFMSRENNFDLLRIISTIAVILIHVNYMFFQYHWMNPGSVNSYV